MDLLCLISGEINGLALQELPVHTCPGDENLSTSM